MRKLFAYIPLLMLLFACSSEEDIVIHNKVEAGDVVDLPFSISLSTQTSKDVRTRAAGDNESQDGIPVPPKPGEANIDKVRLYIFKNTDNDLDISKFKYVAHQTVRPKFSDSGHTDGTHSENDRVFSGYISLEGGSSYYVLAVGYNSQYEKSLTGVEDNPAVDNTQNEPQLFKLETSLSEAKITLKNQATETDKHEYHTPELFVGYLYESSREQASSVTSPIQNITETTQFLGHLYRGVGYVSVNLTDIPVEVEKLTLISERCPAESDVYDGWFITNTDNGDLYPMGYVNSNLELTHTIVDSKDLSGRTAKTDITLGSFFFPFNTLNNKDPNQSSINNRTKFYVDAQLKGEDAPMRLMVKCTSVLEIPTIWIAIFEDLITDYAFIVPINWKTSITGSYNQLKMGNGNMKIDLSPMDSEEIGSLTPQK